MKTPALDDIILTHEARASAATPSCGVLVGMVAERGARKTE